MILLDRDCLRFSFEDVHRDAICEIEFQRTLRIPDDDKHYPLPPGLGRFPLRHLDDYSERLPTNWHRRGGVIAPMYQAEALWISFRSNRGYPFAIKVGTGKCCAITGDKWCNHLNSDPQDYVLIPEQPWLDGYCVEKGVIRQFVAMPLGEGYTVEEQLTGEAEHGGIQLTVYPMKAERFEELFSKRRDIEVHAHLAASAELSVEDASMGLAPGGKMKQEIYEDSYGLDAWDQRQNHRCFVSLVNSTQWRAITAERPPTQAPTAKDYTRAGLPWFDYYGGDHDALEATKKLASVSSISKIGSAKGDQPLPENDSLTADPIVVALGRQRRKQNVVQGDRFSDEIQHISR